ncbi:cupin domain-containing protein [Streptomyces sp. NPDC060198]|uniref:cupin domain-containing protein n=1 Tax=Streptomyces sp. NPDC060198 TaxID=3347070 RepID=UPI00366634A7
MTVEPRLVVAARTADGTSVVAADAPVPATTVAAWPGSRFHLAWGTPDGGARVGDGLPEAVTLPFFAGVGGTRLLFARYEPDATVPAPTGDPDALAAEVQERLPGLWEVFEPGGTGMHATDTLDYGICLEGELHLELDDGEEALITPGTCVVQHGTRHTWHNRGTTAALMCFVGIGAARDR